jgi:hypothetical protein
MLVRWAPRLGPRPQTAVRETPSVPAALLVAYVLFGVLVVWLAARAGVHALVGLVSLWDVRDTLRGEHLAVAATAGALLAVSFVLVGTLFARIPLMVASLR